MTEALKWYMGLQGFYESIRYQLVTSLLNTLWQGTNKIPEFQEMDLRDLKNRGVEFFRSLFEKNSFEFLVTPTFDEHHVTSNDMIT